MTTVEAVRRLGKVDREILKYRLGLKSVFNETLSREDVSKICGVGVWRIKLAESRLMRLVRRGPRAEALANLLAQSC